MDRYEFIGTASKQQFDSKFTMQKAQWPAFLVIHNATIFTSTPGAASAYVTFFRDATAPDPAHIAGIVILVFAYLAFTFILCGCCAEQSWGTLKERPRNVRSKRPLAITNIHPGIHIHPGFRRNH